MVGTRTGKVAGEASEKFTENSNANKEKEKTSEDEKKHLIRCRGVELEGIRASISSRIRISNRLA